MLLSYELPPELITSILQYLPLQALHSLRRLSREWNQFFHRNESFIYHAAAVRHGFISSMDVTFEQAIRTDDPNSQHLIGVKDWRTLCRCHFQLESNWSGRGPITSHMLCSDRADVHRIKADERVGIVITSYGRGGIIVWDLDSCHALWGLPPTYVRTYAHCEYDSGFLIFDRYGQGKEVWRLASEFDASPLPCDERQQAICDAVARSLQGSSRGHFKPWGLLTTPELGRAFRFVYPTLIVAGYDKAYLYDIPSGQLVQVVENIQAVKDGNRLGEINYVEISPLHALICGTEQLRFFERGSGALVYKIAPTAEAIVSKRLAIDGNPGKATGKLQLVQLTTHEARPQVTIDDTEFVAVHASPDGKTVVALLSDCRLLVIKDIVEVIKGKRTLDESSMEILLQCNHHLPGLNPILSPAAVYLAFEHGHVGVVTTSGIFILTLDPTRHGLVDPWTEEHRAQNLQGSTTSSSRSTTAKMVYPFVIACSILPFQDKRSLNRVSCLQMTRTKMFFTWNPRFQFDEPLPQAIEGGAHHDEEHEQFDSPTADDSDDEVTQSLLDDEIDEAAAADDDEFAAYDEMLAEEHASLTQKSLLWVDFAPVR